MVKGINKWYLELGVLFLFSAFVVNSCILSVDEQEMIVPVNAMWHILLSKNMYNIIIIT